MVLLVSPLSGRSLPTMQVINRILVCLGFTFIGGCIYHYDPVLEGSRDALAINGKVTDLAVPFRKAAPVREKYGREILFR